MELFPYKFGSFQYTESYHHQMAAMYPPVATDNKYSVVNELLATRADAICREAVKNWPSVKEIGLLGGKVGIALLLAYQSKLFPRKSFAKSLSDCLDDLGEALSNVELGYNMSDGVAGIAFVFQHLRNIDILDKGQDLNLSMLDEFIARGADRDFQTGNWDSLHGMAGLGIYFLERNRENREKKHLEKIVDYLGELRLSKGNHRVWKTPGYTSYNKDTYNFGMAHGMPGVLSFLAQVHLRGIRQNEIEGMISSCLSFLLEKQYPDGRTDCFPMAIDVDANEKQDRIQSRLGWCYGDLCMVNALIHCSKALHRPDWLAKAMKIAFKTISRSLEQSDCNDPYFCHGTVGVAHQYHRLYQFTNHNSFLYARDRWIGFTQNYLSNPGEFVGITDSHYRVEEMETIEFSQRFSLLEGMTGIALVYLSVLSGIKPDWDIIFLTNV